MSLLSVVKKWRPWFGCKVYQKKKRSVMSCVSLAALVGLKSTSPKSPSWLTCETDPKLYQLIPVTRTFSLPITTIDLVYRLTKAITMSTIPSLLLFLLLYAHKIVYDIIVLFLLFVSLQVPSSDLVMLIQ